MGQRSTLRIYTGGQQRPDVMRKIADEYQKRNPNVKVEIEVSGATSEAQQQYLSTVRSAKDPVLDVILIDVIRPAQWAALIIAIVPICIIIAVFQERVVGGLTSGGVKG